MKERMNYILPILFVACAVFAAFTTMGQTVEYRRMSGMVFGTTYNITYQGGEELRSEVEAVLDSVNNSLSPFNENSVITAVNENREVKLDSMFTEVFRLARQINEDTEGAFDITVAPLVNAWGFGFKNGYMPTDHQVDSLLDIVGMQKVKLESGKIRKTDPRVMLDCSAIAKGYAVDKVAQMLRAKGVKNMMVEIGGEIIAHGKNGNGKVWRIGVTKPNDDTLAVKTEMQTVLKLTNVAMATSGNYRNFYYKDGKKYAHTIDPKSGRPVQQSILSATVIAPTCAVADAYATSFMVIGFKRAIEILKRHPEMKAYLIYNDEKGDYQVWSSPGLAK
jgi:thiamine biosynthesis lipoprotein